MHAAAWGPAVCGAPKRLVGFHILSRTYLVREFLSALSVQDLYYCYVEPRSVLDRQRTSQRAVLDQRLKPPLSLTRRVPLRAVVDTRISRLFSCHHIDGSGATNQHLVPVGRAVCSATARRNYAWLASNWTERCLLGRPLKSAGCCEYLGLCMCVCVLFKRMASEHIFISFMIHATVPSVGSIERSDEERTINCRKSRSSRMLDTILAFFFWLNRRKIR
jgi:hypothetical protein